MLNHVLTNINNIQYEINTMMNTIIFMINTTFFLRLEPYFVEENFGTRHIEQFWFLLRVRDRESQLLCK